MGLGDGGPPRLREAARTTRAGWEAFCLRLGVEKARLCSNAAESPKNATFFSDIFEKVRGCRAVWLVPYSDRWE